MGNDDESISLKPDGSDSIPFISSSSQGSFTSLHDGFSVNFTMSIYLISIIFFGVMVTNIQTTRGFGVGLFYMILLVIALILMVVEYQKEDNETLIAIVDFGEPKKWLITIPIGLGIGIIFAVALRTFTGSFLTLQNIEIFGIDLELIIMIVSPVIAIPVVEEAFFGGFLTPTFAERYGIVIATLLVTLIWVLWHLGTYQSSFEVLVGLAAFRIVITPIILATKSLMPGIVSHIVINFFGTFFT